MKGRKIPLESWERAKWGFWAEALRGDYVEVVHTNVVGTASWGMGDHQRKRLECYLLVKGFNMLGEALEKLWILTGPQPHLDPVFYTVE